MATKANPQDENLDQASHAQRTEGGKRSQCSTSQRRRNRSTISLRREKGQRKTCSGEKPRPRTSSGEDRQGRSSRSRIREGIKNGCKQKNKTQGLSVGGKTEEFLGKEGMKRVLTEKDRKLREVRGKRKKEEKKRTWSGKKKRGFGGRGRKGGYRLRLSQNWEGNMRAHASNNPFLDN